MLLRRLLTPTFCLLIPASLACAQQQTLTVNAAHSQVGFTLSDPLHMVNGTFQVQQGEITFNAGDGTMKGSIAVDPASGASGNATRDRKMTQDQMQAKKYRSVTFTPQHFSGTLNRQGDSNINVSGTFVLLGKPHEIMVPMKVHRQGSDLRVTGSFEVPFVEWGVKDPSVFLLRVNKQVTVNLDLSGNVAP
jgi:polyisoprenoid-binding protein YceI